MTVGTTEAEERRYGELQQMALDHARHGETGPLSAMLQAGMPVNLADAKSQQPMGRMFWDQATDRWTFTAHHLPMPAKGRTYQLWLVVAGQKVSVGTYLPSAGGDAEVRQTFAVKPGTLQAVAVTDEPTGGMPQPTGPMVVLGKAAQ